MKELKKYYRQIQKWLPCGGPLKRKLMANITATIEEYRSANPDATFADLQEHFGVPQQIAIAFVDEMETEKLLNALNLRRKIATIACFIAIGIILVLTCFVLAIYLEVLSNMNGYGVVEIV